LRLWAVLAVIPCIPFIPVNLEVFLSFPLSLIDFLCGVRRFASGCRMETRIHPADRNSPDGFQTRTGPSESRHAVSGVPLRQETQMSEYGKPSKDAIKKKLTPEQFSVVCNAAAEPPFQNAFWNHQEAGIETVELAGGCFWGMQHLLRKIPGVIRTEVGYAGGQVKNATYRNHEGHAEAVRVEYDPLKLPFEQLLRWFFRMHDPTTRDRQGNDRGSSYRSAIFYHTEDQKKTAEALIDRLNQKGKWSAPVVTEVTGADQYWKAEEDHQDYLERLPKGYTCHFLRPESVLGD